MYPYPEISVRNEPSTYISQVRKSETRIGLVTFSRSHHLLYEALITESSESYTSVMFISSHLYPMDHLFQNLLEGVNKNIAC